MNERCHERWAEATAGVGRGGLSDGLVLESGGHPPALFRWAIVGVAALATLAWHGDLGSVGLGGAALCLLGIWYGGRLQRNRAWIQVDSGGLAWGPCLDEPGEWVDWEEVRRIDLLAGARRRRGFSPAGLSGPQVEIRLHDGGRRRIAPLRDPSVLDRLALKVEVARRAGWAHPHLAVVRREVA